MRKEYFSKASLTFPDGEEYWFTLKMPAFEPDRDNLDSFCAELCEQIDEKVTEAYAQKYNINLKEEK